MPRYKVLCWNCDEGHIEPVDEWDTDVCDICKGEGVLIVTELTDDNCEEAVRIDDLEDENVRYGTLPPA